MNLAVSPVAVFSSDVDWASAACIADTVDLAAEYGIKPSFFATHESPLLSELNAAGRVELAVHPNFLPDSTHGPDMDSVVRHVMRLVPRTQGFRSHGFVDSTAIARAFRACGLRWDSNLCLYLQDGLMPLRHASGLVRFPVFWEDDIHMDRGGSWDVRAVVDQFLSPGLKVLDIHPIHLALNTPDLAFYQRHKARTQRLTSDEIENARHRGEGTRSFVGELLRRLRQADVRFYTFAELMEFVSDESDPAGRSDRLTPENHRQYWEAEPEARQAMLRELYNQRDAADPYATSRDHNQRELEIFAISGALDHSHDGTIVDLGCGNGWTLISLGRHLEARRLIGIDFAERLIEGALSVVARTRSELKSVPEFRCADAIAYMEGIEPASVDCVITERFLLNLPDEPAQRAVIRKIYRALTPGGRFLMCEGSMEGFRALNVLRTKMGLAAIAETSADNVSSRRLEDAEIQRFVSEDVGFELLSKLGFSTFFAVSRALYPALVAPQRPSFSNRINDLARILQESLPLEPGLGSNVLWVLRKPEEL